jgi:DNA polymerase I
MKTLLIDSSYLMYRSYFAYPNLTHNNKPVGAFFGFAKTILQLIQAYKPDQLIFAGDTSEPTWRHYNYPEYKAGRAKIEDSMVVQIPLIQNWSAKITENNFRLAGWEADDIIFTVAVQELTNFKSINLKSQTTKINKTASNNLLKNEIDMSFDGQVPVFGHQWSELLDGANQLANSIYVFSSDRDLYQILHLANLQFINSAKGVLEEFGNREFQAKYELDPLQWLDYKALVGDGSDNLKGVDGVGPKTATTFLQQVGSLYNFYKALDMDNEVFVRTASGQWQGQNNLTQYLANTKNQALINKLKDNHEIVKITYTLSALMLVPAMKFHTTGYDLSLGQSDLEACGFKSLVTIQNKVQPVEEEGLF